MDHLGGHGDRTWTDEGVLSFLSNTFGISSMLDIGCGPGGMKEIAESLNIDWTGIDGDPSVEKEGILIHDFTKGSVKDLPIFDLGWSVEFLEHVEEQYQPHYMHAFSRCKYVVCTAAPPGFEGVHHVNEQFVKYWIKVFNEHGFIYNREATEVMMRHSTMNKHNKTQRNFIEMTGMFFRNIDIYEN